MASCILILGFRNQNCIAIDVVFSSFRKIDDDGDGDDDDGDNDDDDDDDGNDDRLSVVLRFSSFLAKFSLLS